MISVAFVSIVPSWSFVRNGAGGLIGVPVGGVGRSLTSNRAVCILGARPVVAVGESEDVTGPKMPKMTGLPVVADARVGEGGRCKLVTDVWRK